MLVSPGHRATCSLSQERKLHFLMNCASTASYKAADISIANLKRQKRPFQIKWNWCTVLLLPLMLMRLDPLEWNCTFTGAWDETTDKSRWKSFLFICYSSATWCTLGQLLMARRERERERERRHRSTHFVPLSFSTFTVTLPRMQCVAVTSISEECCR